MPPARSKCEARPTRTVATSFEAVRRPPVSVWLGHCASRAIRRPETRHSPRRTAFGGARQTVFSTGESASRQRGRRRAEGGGSVLVWPVPGRGSDRALAGSHSRVRSHAVSRRGTHASPACREGHSAIAHGAEANGPTRSHSARSSSGRSSRLGSPRGRASMRSSRSGSSRAVRPSRGPPRSPLSPWARSHPPDPIREAGDELRGSRLGRPSSSAAPSARRPAGPPGRATPR